MLIPEHYPYRLDIEEFGEARRVASGGLSDVYRSADLSRALKVIKPQLHQHEIIRERFARECEVTTLLASQVPETTPGVLGVIDDVRAKDTYSGDQFEMGRGLVMEYLDGRDLRLVKSKDLPHGEIARIGAHVGHALFQSHRRGILHRDVKIDNVRIAGDRVVLIDYGACHVCGEKRLEPPGNVMGSPAYFSPELLLGKDADVTDDLYALGVMLHELVEYQRLFTEGFDVRREKVRRGEFPRPQLGEAAVDSELREVTLTLLDPEREGRYKNAYAPACLLARAAVRMNPELRAQPLLSELAGCA